jgi:hypothetical protein
MATLKLGTKTFKALVAGAHRIADKYHLRVPSPSGAFREAQFATAPATNFRKRIDHGFRYRLHGPLTVLYVQTTEAFLASEIEDDIEAITLDDGITITYPSGEEYDNCFLVGGSPRQIGDRFKSEAGATWYCQIEFQFEQDGA